MFAWLWLNLIISPHPARAVPAAGASARCGCALDDFDRRVRWEAIALILADHQTSEERALIAEIEPFLTEDLRRLGHLVLDRPRPRPKTVPADGRSLRLPHGFTPGDFRALVETYRTHHVFDQTESLIIFGSRLNFDYGQAPHPASDLDVLITRRDHPDTFASSAAPWHEVVDPAFADLALSLGFPINVIPEDGPHPSLSLETIIARATTRSARVAQRARWDALAPRYVLETQLKFAQPDFTPPDDQTPLAAFKHRWRGGAEETFTKDTIFVIRRSPRSDAYRSALRERGHDQVLVIEPDSPGVPAARPKFNHHDSR